MRIFGFISDDKKLGTRDQQREAIGPVDVELFENDRAGLLENTGLILRRGEGDRIVIAHARAFGRYKRGFSQRQQMLEHLAALGVSVQIGKDGQPMTFNEASAVADFHAQALSPTGIASPKQKKQAGRPKTYIKPEGDKLELAREWYAGKLHTDDVGKLIGQMMGTKAVSRATLAAWFGKRPKCEGRDRRPRSDKGKSKEPSNDA